MKIVTTRFAATLLQSMYPNSIPVTASVYPFLHSSKRYVLPNLPLCEIEIGCSGSDVGAALHWWARMEVLNHIKNKCSKSAAMLDYFQMHKVDFWDFDIEAGLKFCQRNVKVSVSIAHFDPKHVLQSSQRKTPTLAQKLIAANTQIKAYCAQQGYDAHPMFVSVIALKFNTKYTNYQIAHNLGIKSRMVQYHLAKLPTLPFSIPSNVLSPPLETS